MTDVFSAQNPNVSEFLAAVLGIHGKFVKMIREVFGGHKDFRSALDRVSDIIMMSWHYNTRDAVALPCRHAACLSTSQKSQSNIRKLRYW